MLWCTYRQTNKQKGYACWDISFSEAFATSAKYACRFVKNLRKISALKISLRISNMFEHRPSSAIIVFYAWNFFSHEPCNYISDIAGLGHSRYQGYHGLSSVRMKTYHGCVTTDTPILQPAIKMNLTSIESQELFHWLAGGFDWDNIHSHHFIGKRISDIWRIGRRI